MRRGRDEGPRIVTLSTARTVWARRFLELLDRSGFGPLLTRARGDVRRGFVQSLEIVPGVIRAQVQIHPTIRERATAEVVVAPLPPERVERALASIPQGAVVAAQLLAGTMPDELVQALEATGLALLPTERGEFLPRCSCPSVTPPCLHVVALCALAVGEIERDPLLLLDLRGIPRGELLTRFTAPPTAATGPEVAAAPDATTSTPAPPRVALSPELPADIGRFWRGGDLPDLPQGPMAIPPFSGNLLRRLGPFPFWRGSSPLIGSLDPIYRSAAITAAAIWLGPLLEEEEDEED